MAARRLVSSAMRSVRTRSAAVVEAAESELAALRQKEKLPWSQLSVAEKTTLYRSQFGKSRAEIMVGETDTVKVIVGTVIGLGVSVAAFVGLQSFAATPPKTLTPEWKAARDAQYPGSNPVTHRND
eukprot:m.36977 g.36977  ORF g.36977 m.36977 type:complete len:126 (+) comp10059_c0_seq1:168-545(+)